MARHTGSALLVTGLADLVVSGPRDGRNALGWFQRLGVAKLDFRSPHSTSDMNPVIIRGALERLARVHGAVHVLLLLAVELGSLAGLLNLELFSLSILLGHLLLMMCKLRQLHEVMLGVLNGAQDTFVLLFILSVTG
jgi:hypothetical protein